MNNTRKLVESALMAAIIGAFVIIDRYTVGFMSYFIFLLPLPMVYLSCKYDAKTASMSTFGSVVLTFIFGNIPTTIVVLIECIIGIVYGSGLRKKENSSTLLFKVIVLAILMNFVTVVLSAAFFGYDIVSEAQMIQDIITGAFTEASVEIQIPDLRSYVEVLVVLSIVLTGVLEGYLTHISSRLLLSRLKFDISKPTPIFFHKPNKIMGYVALLVSGVLIVSLRYNIEETWLRYGILFVGMLGYMYLIGYGCIGAIVLLRAYFPSLRIIGVFFILFAVLFMSFGLMILGFLYITTNMRETAVERIINDSQNRSTKV